MGSRMKLFDAVVAPCALYACATWTLTIERERQLRSTRRQMLRKMFRVARRDGEEWPDYVRRATHTCEDLATKCGSVDWISIQRKRKWKFAGQCASRSDRRWSCRLLTWRPWFRCLPRRDAGHPLKRWDDDITAFAGGSWTDTARSASEWRVLADGFIQRLA